MNIIIKEMKPIIHYFYLCEVLSLAMIVIEIKYQYKLDLPSVLQISVKPGDMIWKKSRNTHIA